MWNLKQTVNEPYAWIPLFNPEECAKIIDIGLNGTVISSLISNRVLNQTIRSGNVVWLDASNTDCNWIFQKCTDAVLHMNERFFKYDLSYIEDMQFTIYDEIGDHYAKHVDYGYNDTSATRKLSFSIQLSDPSLYDGGDLVLHLNDNPIQVKRDQGMMNLFPSYTMHEVTPITAGKRYSLVGWVHGPKFK